MQKMMFSDKFGLTQAVLEGRKTMTRRMIDVNPEFQLVADFFDKEGRLCVTFDSEDGNIGDFMFRSIYKLGEVVAVAQSYKDAGCASDMIQEGRAVRKSVHSEDWNDSMIGKLGEWYIDQLAGWNNKMFTHPEMMPHRIRFTGINVEKLQDISDKGCLKEGVRKVDYGRNDPYFIYEKKREEVVSWNKEPKFAFAALIDKVSGKGTWERNPYVFAYEFELVK